jgi:hypothetical protein
MSVHEAARLGDRELVKKLLKKDGRKNCVNLEDAYGQTALHIAAEEGHAELVAFLVDKYGAKVNAKDQAGWTPLFCACKWGRVRVADLLLHRGADAGMRSNDNATALHYYVRHDYPALGAADAALPGLALRVLRALLDSGADQNAQNTNGEIPLHIAAYTGVVSSVESLLSLGSALDSTDRYCSPLSFLFRSCALCVTLASDPGSSSDADPLPGLASTRRTQERRDTAAPRGAPWPQSSYRPPSRLRSRSHHPRRRVRHAQGGSFLV